MLKKPLIRRSLIAGAVLTMSLTPAVRAGAPEVGVLVMAHGGTSEWNKTVKATVKKAQIPYPTRVYFGMGHSQEEVDELGDAVRWLDNKGVQTIIVVPLAISSYSEVLRQWRYLLAVDFKPGFINNVFFPIQHRAEIRFTEALNDDPIVSEILLDRASTVSQDPEQESIMIIAHGPNNETDNQRWLEKMAKISEQMKKQGPFAGVEVATLRDDAPADVRGQAIQTLRDKVVEMGRQKHRVVVVPLLLAPGGIESKIRIALKGLDYILNTKTLLPDPRITQWLKDKATP